MEDATMQACPEWQRQFDEERRIRTYAMGQGCGVKSRVLGDGYWHKCDMSNPGHEPPHICRCPKTFSRAEEEA
jgi:hypothetical protein